MTRGRRVEYRKRTTICLNAEIDVLQEIKELCQKERKSLSEKVNELFIGELEKKVKGDSPNPINILYNNETQKPSLGTLDMWIRRDDAIQLIKDVDTDMAEHVGVNMIVAARFKRTGIIRDIKVI